MSDRDELSKAEIHKDALQETVEATATAVGSATTIVTGAVRDVARVVGGLATDLFEIRDAARRARAEHESDQDAAGDAGDPDVDGMSGEPTEG